MNQGQLTERAIADGEHCLLQELRLSTGAAAPDVATVQKAVASQTPNLA